LAASSSKRLAQGAARSMASFCSGDMVPSCCCSNRSNNSYMHVLIKTPLLLCELFSHILYVSFLHMSREAWRQHGKIQSTPFGTSKAEQPNTRPVRQANQCLKICNPDVRESKKLP